MPVVIRSPLHWRSEGSSLRGARRLRLIQSNAPSPDERSRRGFVYAGGELLARVEGGEVRWEHRQPTTGGRWESAPSGAAWALTELDPLGADLGTESPYEPGFTPAEPAIFDAGSHWASRAGSPADPRSGCAVNGMELPCEVFLRMIDDGVLSMRVNDPRGPGQMELPLSGWGLGPVWVDTSDQLRPRLDPTMHVAEEIVTVGTDPRSSGFFFFLPVGRAAETTITPQKATRIDVPIDADKLKELIQDRLDYGDCNDYVAKLINKAGELSGAGNPVSSTDIMYLFEKIRTQPKGGVLFQAAGARHPHYPNLPPVAGGSGWAWGSFNLGNATINVSPRGYFSDRPQDYERTVHQIGITGLHEVIHLAGKNGTYSEEIMTQAAQLLEPDAGITWWDNALEAHCAPKSSH